MYMVAYWIKAQLVINQRILSFLKVITVYLQWLVEGAYLLRVKLGAYHCSGSIKL